jgi:hypothetical protein
MRDFDEAFARLAAHALRRRIGRQQFGVLRFQIAQLPHQRVIFGIADFGLVQHIVQALVMAQRFPQLLDLSGNIFRHRRYHYSLVRRGAVPGCRDDKTTERAWPWYPAGTPPLPSA